MGMLFSCGNTTKEIKEITFEEDFPNEVTEDATIYYSDSAMLRVKLKAPRIERFYEDGGKAVFSNGIDVEFYNKSDSLEATITSEWAVQYVAKEIMEARNNVVVVNKKGEQLNTEQLLWDRKAGEIRSDAFVKITTAEEIIYGDGLISNEDFTRYEVQHIKGIIAVEEEQDEKVP